MQEFRHGSHRFSNYGENIAFTNEDGIDGFRTGTRFQQALCGGELELPLETKEIIGSYLMDKHRNPQSLHDFHVIDLL